MKNNLTCSLAVMKRLFVILPALLLSLTMAAEKKVPLHVFVLGDDPMMVSDETSGSVGYATMLQPLFDNLVTIHVEASADLLPNDAASLLEPAGKGDVVLLCKRPVEMDVEELTMADIYLNQLQAIQHAAQKKGVKVIWLTPVCPRFYTAEGVQVHRLGIYPDVVRRMCQRDALPIVDIEALTFDWLYTTGAEGTAAAFVPVTPAIPAAAEKAAREGYALTETGAQQVVAFIGEAIRADKRNILNKRLQ